jgi:hypothetical protein
MSAPQRSRDDGAELKDLIDQVDMRSLYERLTGKSANGKRTSKGPKVRCPNPACSDKDPSAVIWDEDKAIKLFDTCTFANGKSFGGVLDLIQFTGHANSKRDAVEWLKSSGLVGLHYDPALSERVVSMRDNGRGGRTQRLYDLTNAGNYDYTDSTGQTIHYRVVRWEGFTLPADADPAERSKSKTKIFSQYHPDPGEGDHCAICAHYRKNLPEYRDPRFAEMPRLMAPRHPGKFEKGTYGIARVPYRLHEVLEGARKQFPIFYVEGEKKVEALRKLGLYATTNMGGAQFPLPAEWSQYFEGAARVVFVPDCDVPGRESAWQRLKVFKKQGLPTLFLDIKPGFNGPGKYDIFDWYAEREALGKDAMLAELRGMYRDAMEIEKLGRVLVIGEKVDGPRYEACASFSDAIDLVKERDFAAIDIRASGPAATLKTLMEVAAAEGVTNVRTTDSDAHRYFLNKRALVGVRL